MPVESWFGSQVKEEAAERAMELAWIPSRGQKRIPMSIFTSVSRTVLDQLDCAMSDAFPKYILIRPSTVEESGQPFRLSLGLRRYFSTSVAVP